MATHKDYAKTFQGRRKNKVGGTPIIPPKTHGCVLGGNFLYLTLSYKDDIIIKDLKLPTCRREVNVY